MKGRILYTTITILLLVITAGFFIIYGAGNRIRLGVSIEGINFSGYTIKQAEKKLMDIYQAREQKEGMTLFYKEKEWKIPYSKLKLHYDIKLAVSEAYSKGRNKNIFQNIFIRENVRIPINFEKTVLTREIQKISNEINIPSQNAYVEVEKTGLIKKYPEVEGKKLNTNLAHKLISTNLATLGKQRIELPVDIEKPMYTMKDIEGIEAEIGSSETKFSTGQSNRAYNIQRAVKAINGKLILPGEVMSLNKTIGPRSEKNGFKEAPVIVKNQLVPGIGGGVCQVASTLYKAGLQSGLKVIEREHHTFPPDYIPIGQDATIAGDYIDLKLKNITSDAVFINSYVVDNRIVIKMLSKKKNPDQKVKLESQILEVVEAGPSEIIRDPSILSGNVKREREEKKGYKVAVYKNTYRNGMLIGREQVSYDYYKPIRAVTRIGVAERNSETREVVMPQIFELLDERSKYIEEPDNPPEE